MNYTDSKEGKIPMLIVLNFVCFMLFNVFRWEFFNPMFYCKTA